MSLKTQRQGQIGVNQVESIILNDWQSRWQPIDGHNDDGVDGLIFIEKGGEITGQIVYAQVKCMTTVKCNQQGFFRIPVGFDKLSRNMQRWRRVVGAAILIYIDPKVRRCFWVNLREPGAVRGSQVFVPRHQIFDAEAKQQIARLCGNIHRDLLAQHVETDASDFYHLRGPEHIQVAARKLYLELKHKPVRLGGCGPVVLFDRKGWRHISRPARARLTRYQSFVLLGTVRRVLENTCEDDLQQHQSVADPYGKFVSARAAVSFPFRQTGIIKIILRVAAEDNAAAYSFHTVYEPRRRRDVLGVRKPLSR